MTVVGVNATVTPLGVVPIHELDRVTSSLKPRIEVTVIVDASELPGVVDIVLFDGKIVKSGVEGVEDESMKTVLESAPSQ